MYGWQDIEEYKAADPASEVIVRGWTGRLPCARLYSDAEHSSRQETGAEGGLGAHRIDALVQLGLGRLYARTEGKQFDLMCGERATVPEAAVTQAAAGGNLFQRDLSVYRERVKGELEQYPDWGNIASLVQ